MYQVQQWVDGRWYPIGGTFPSYPAAADKVAQYMLQGQQYGKPGTVKKQPRFRIVPSR
jgi:hypothetical protein